MHLILIFIFSFFYKLFTSSYYDYFFQLTVFASSLSPTDSVFYKISEKKKNFFFSGEVVPPEKLSPTTFKPSKYIYKRTDRTDLWKSLNKPLTAEEVNIFAIVDDFML